MSSSAEAAQESKASGKPALKKELDLWSLVGLGAGDTIGSGIFGLIAAYGADAGSCSAMTSFIIKVAVPRR